MNPLWPDGDPVGVWSDRWGTPQRFTWHGDSHQVQGIAKRWRVDQGWCRQRIWREYFKLYTTTGLLVILFRDLLTDQWYLQRLYD